MRSALLLIAFAALAAPALADGGRVRHATQAANRAAQRAAEAAEAAANASEAAEPPHPAWMAEGQWLFAGEAGDGSIWYFEAQDSNFLRSPFQVRLRTDESPNPARAYNNSERLAEIDCAGRRYRILRTTNYDEGGLATEADERGDGRLRPVPPGSVFETVRETVCRYSRHPWSTSTDAR